jgi:cytochrome b pre-mRNA-processing protein 3
MSGIMKLLGIFRAGGPEAAAKQLYATLVAQARQPGFYTACGVPDTPDGRFDMILLHAFLLLRRLKRDHAKTVALGQAVFDLMFADMDQNLREMGVGDLSVGKRVKAMAQAFYGRIAAYETGLAASNGGTLAHALRRNLYRKMHPADADLARIADYLRREADNLDQQLLDAMLKGDVRFGPAPEDRAEESR